MIATAALQVAEGEDDEQPPKAAKKSAPAERDSNGCCVKDGDPVRFALKDLDEPITGGAERDAIGRRT